ncbi:MAG: divalent metal cation transporter, partial [Bacteroidota bacterium]
VIILILSISTILAVAFAYSKYDQSVSWQQTFPTNSLDIIFLISFMGWMPAPLDISIWHSLWSIEKKKDEKSYTPKSALFDFNIGYAGTLVLGFGFLLLGYFVMYHSGETFSDKAGVFSNQLIEIYVESLGSWSYIIIGIAAFTTMFSTTLTTLDASPRAMDRSSKLLFNKTFEKGYVFWIVVLTVGTLFIFFVLVSEMGLLVRIATVVSFLTAPFYAIMNYLLITSKHTPKAWHPSKWLRILSLVGILFLISFSIWYLTLL